MEMPHSRGRGFTLIELLVVIAIIGVLVALIRRGALRLRGGHVQFISTSTNKLIFRALSTRAGGEPIGDF